MINTKICTKCNTIKDINDFHKCKYNIDGLYFWCKDCKRDYDFKRRQSEEQKQFYKTALICLFMLRIMLLDWLVKKAI